MDSSTENTSHEEITLTDEDVKAACDEAGAKSYTLPNALAEVNAMLDRTARKQQRIDAAAALMADNRFVEAIFVGGASLARTIGAKLAPYGQGPRAVAEAIRTFKSADADDDDEDGSDGSGNLSSQYVLGEHDGCFYLMEPKGITQLCNFSAQIEEYVRREGSAGDSKEEYRISGVLAGGRPLPTLSVPVDDFRGMGWIYRWPNIWIDGKRGCDAHIRSFIMKLSKDAPVRTTYNHVGWRQIDGKWCYLTPQGAIGNPDARVEISDPKFGRFKFETEGDVVQAVRRSLALLDMGPPEVTYPLASAMYTGPMSTALKVRFGVYALGRTGSAKTLYTALLQAHFGPEFVEAEDLLNWESTGNAIEDHLHGYRDAMLLFDNYLPLQGKGQVERERLALRIIQLLGDRSSRQRQGRDNEARASKAPAGICVMTGEDLPPSNESTIGRLHVVTVPKGVMPATDLLSYRRHAGELSRAMHGYITWLAQDYEGITEWARGELHDATAVYRDLLPADDLHGRVHGNLGTLTVGLACFLRFAVEVGAISEYEKNRRLAECVDALIHGGEQSSTHTEGSAVVRYMTTLRTLLQQGRVALAPPEDGLDAHSTPQVRCIGWLASEDGEVWLSPSHAWEEVERFHGRDRWTFQKLRLHRELAEAGLIPPGERIGDRDRTAVRRRAGGRQVGVLAFALDQFADWLPTASTAPRPDEVHLASDGSETYVYQH